ncbi:MAG: right-handed parallel beta-helix repeat-containing protein [Candidatus Bipolaricaulota bacterium]|nr:right-handed parallel beta-helix repeat-containing protein [Candidatus Bipolaricaulota bacterium]MDW8030633.1 right-handed parallel beta-helix repeat-containing protein [Candidatus Bipolaricaulota bacterium]
MKLSKLVIGLAVGLVGLGLLAPVPSSGGQGGKTWTVCPQGCDFPRIQEAIDAAVDGDTILIKASGIYRENLTITKSLTIAPDRAFAFPVVLQPAGAFIGPVITVKGERAIRVTFESLIVQGVGLEQISAITILGQANVSLNDIEIGPSLYFGLIVYDQAQVMVKNSRFSGNGASAIIISGSAQAVLEDSIVFANGVTGINISEKGQLRVTRSAIFRTKLDLIGPGISIAAGDQSKVVIEGSLIYDNNLDGVLASESSTVEIINSVIANNGRSGVLLINNPTVIVKESIIHSNPWGIAAWLLKCGFDRDWYSGGTVQIDQATVFVRNSKGDVCLP